MSQSHARAAEQWRNDQSYLWLQAEELSEFPPGIRFIL